MFNNTEGQVTDLPVEIQEFYTEEVRSEPVEGEFTYTEVTYEDVEGNTQTRTVEHQVYQDVTYTVEKPRYDLKSWATVDKVTDPTFKVYCIEKACEAERWDYHDEYITWFCRPEPVRVQDEEGKFVGDDPDTPESEAWVDGFTPAMYNAQLAPVDGSKDPTEVIASMHADNAVLARMEAIYADLEHEGVMFQMGEGKDGISGISNFKDAITNVQLSGDTTSSVQWIASDNNVYNLYYADIKAIILAFNARKQAIFNAYSVWRAGDRMEAFVPDI